MKLSFTVPWLLIAVGPAAALRGSRNAIAFNDTITTTRNDATTPTTVRVSPSLTDDLLLNRSSTRRLFGDHMNFHPLSCNNPRCNAGVSTWKQMGFDPSSEKVVIPCGKCVTMNYDASPTLELPNGIDIQGVLKFPDDYRLTIVTPFVLVQGELEMYATRKVTDVPNIKFILTGTNEGITKFVPAGENKFACSNPGATTPKPCSEGKKPFVVAGGKLTIRGVPQDCPTWVKLQEVLTGDMPAPTDFSQLPTEPRNRNNPRCSAPGGVYMDEDFSTTDNVHDWTAGYGAFTRITEEGTFLVWNRLDSRDQYPTWDMKFIRDCLHPDTTYLFRARIKLTKAGVSSGTPTTCATSKNNCIILQSIVNTPGKPIYHRKGWEDQIHQTRYGEWYDFHATVVYSNEELDEANIYQILQLQGPEPGVLMEMDDVRFSLPPLEAVPDPREVCGGNLVKNGDAELDIIHPYPINNFGGYLSVKKEENGNQFFRLTERNNNGNSVFYQLMAPECLVPNGKYRASARIRMLSDSPVRSRMELRSVHQGGRVIQRVLAECPPSTRSEWTICQSVVTMDEALFGENLESIRVQFETFGAATVGMDVDDIRIAFMDGSVNSILVPDDGVSSCWDTGAEILVTSHTMNHDDAQVRQIIAPPTPTGDGFVMLDLDSPLVPPTSLKDSPEFAVEVALLSRNILFEGDTDDSNSLFGAHFIVMHTPDVAQLIEGIEFRNFGQQGILGRYPMHFHLCGNVEGAVISKNSFRGSKQRCVVIHGSHNVTVVDNVSYDNFGHCYMTEDGGELDNVFKGNLGAVTRPASDLVGPDESDGIPATFWISNPSNEWIGNVAAGCQDNGFWFELLLAVRGPTATMPLSAGMNPRALPLKAFRDNISHSNGKHGVRTYPHGFMPPEEAIFYNTRSYKNKWDGFFIHNTRNVAVEGGIFANNEIQVDFDKAENLRLEGASLIGLTDEYKAILNAQNDAPAHTESLIGLDLHGFTTNMERSGATIKDLLFSGFVDTGSSRSALIAVDSEVEHGHFDYWTTLSGVQIEGDITPEQFDFSGAIAEGIRNIYITDLDSSMRPSGFPATGVSTVLSNTPEMTHFLDTDSKCASFPSRGYIYCRETCLRTVLFTVDPTETEDFTLRVTEVGNPSNTFDYEGKYYYETLDDGAPDKIANSWIRKGRYFAAALPPGNYVARFRRNSSQDWPTHAEVTVEDAQCPGALAVSDVTLVPPPSSQAQCLDLIKNGELQASNVDFPHWVHHQGGLELANGKGIGGSNAIADVDQAMGNRLIGQYLDTRCLQQGRQYEFQAWVRLERNGTPMTCDKGNGCPRARLRIRTPVDESGSRFLETNMDLTDYFMRPYQTGDWNLLQGTFGINSVIASGSSVLFFIEPRIARVKTYVDSVSVRLIEDDCSELVMNGDFAEATSRFWEKNVNDDSVKLNLVTIDGNKALEMSGRFSLTHSPLQNTRLGCMELGERFVVTARVRLNKSDGSLFECNPTRPTGDLGCPRVRMRSFINLRLPNQDVKSHNGGSVAVTDHGTTPDGWYTMSGTFNANDYDVAAEKMELYFDQISSSKDFVIDDVSVKPTPMDCSQLFLNGDAEYGPTPSFWRHWTNGGNAKLELISTGGGNHAFKLSNRGTNAADGIHQFVDPRCLETGSRWKFAAKMKLVNSTGDGIQCDPADDRVNPGCPPIRLAGWSGDTSVINQKLHMTNRPNWSPNSFNPYEVEFTVDNLLGNSDRVSVAIRNYNADWDLIVDDLTLAPLT